MRFDVPSPYAEILLFIFILIPILGLTLLGNYFDQRKRSKLSHGPRSHYEYGQFAKHFADQGVPEELYYTVYRCLQESFEDSRFKVMPSDALSLYQDGNGSMDAKSLFEFIQSERLLKKYGLEMPGKAELGRAKTVEEVVQLANRYLRSK